ncbi:MAG: hypothetical protein SPF56_08640 [Bacteroidaceae bacterium]|nr:hypothetical protein [Bacteroidaceae bacterium]
MKYKLIDLQRDVRIAIDENMVSTALLGEGDIDTLGLNEIILSKIVDAARAVCEAAPTHMLGRGEPFAESIKWKHARGIGMGSIHLPDDFMRLITFQMSDWSRAVTTAISEDSPQYALQCSRYPGISGNPQNPVVAITVQPIGLVLEFYGCSAGDAAFVRRARYLPYPRVEHGETDLPERLRTSIVYYTAYLTALSVGNNELASSMLNQSKEYMK